MKAVLSLQEAISKVKPGNVVGISGFLAVGEPLELIEELVRQNQQELKNMLLPTLVHLLLLKKHTLVEKWK